MLKALRVVSKDNQIPFRMKEIISNQTVIGFHLSNQMNMYKQRLNTETVTRFQISLDLLVKISIGMYRLQFLVVNYLYALQHAPLRASTAAVQFCGKRCFKTDD